MQKNVFDATRDDAVRKARSGRDRSAHSGANYDTGGTIIGGTVLTRRDETGAAVGPFIVDATPVDDEHSMIL